MIENAVAELGALFGTERQHIWPGFLFGKRLRVLVERVSIAD
jgi:hypothetical protein